MYASVNCLLASGILGVHNLVQLTENSHRGDLPIIFQFAQNVRINVVHLDQESEKHKENIFLIDLGEFVHVAPEQAREFSCVIG